MVRSFSLRYTIFLVLSDVALLGSALGLATFARLNLPFGRSAPEAQIILPLLLYIIVISIYLCVFALQGVYVPKQVNHIIAEIQVLFVSVLIGSLILSGVLYFTFRLVSRLQVIYFVLLLLMLVAIHRITLRLLFRNGRLTHRNCIVVATNSDTAQRVTEALLNYEWAGIDFAGFVTTDASTDLKRKPVLGTISEIEPIIEKHQVSEVIIAIPPQEQYNVRPLVHTLQEQSVNVRIIPDYYDLAFLTLRVEELDGMPFVTLKEPRLDELQRFTKRIFDLILGSLAFIVSLPLMLFIALLIKLDSHGAAIFQQKRVGEGGRLFTMYKFRTMTLDAEERLEEVVENNADGEIVHKKANDPRITRVGKFLRRSSLDELPQLYNVLRGDMSLVGPRPEMPWLVDTYEPWQRKRFEVPQGITGWWQINGRAERPMHLNTDEDLFYIRNYSLMLDLYILWKTLGAAVRGRGAY